MPFVHWRATLSKYPNTTLSAASQWTCASRGAALTPIMGGFFPWSGLILGLSLLACRGDKETSTIDTGTVGATTTTAASTDLDGDGYTSSADCDDSEATVNPGATEICDGIDNNCDGSVDEGVTGTFYADTDTDGYGAADDTVEACSAPSGYATNSGDCDDSDADSYPSAAERCDGVDNDCDGDVDEDKLTTWYADADADGYGDAETITDDCDPDAGWVAEAGDCDDENAAAHPDATETCDGVDNDCDEQIDEELLSVWYADADSDGYGDLDTSQEACEATEGWTGDPSDCDDTDPSVNPGAAEICNEIDDDCDGTIDGSDAADAETWYIDSDGDGYGSPSAQTDACEAPSGFAETNTDCDDTDDTINPDAVEVCDELDNDCDGDTDGGAADASTWYADADGDEYGDSAETLEACETPSGYVSDDTDCDDTAAGSNPGATEICDEADNDCDGSVDEEVTSTFYADADSDGYGAASDSIEACTAPSGYTGDDTDCNDAGASENPGAAEVCDELDNDCDGDTDEEVLSTFYADSDGDGFGDPDSAAEACAAPSDMVSDASDCDDTDEDANPSAAETCDEADNDCDGDIDEGVTSTFYTDADSDGFGDGDSSVEACTAASGTVSDDTDCDDADDAINPNAVEVCDEVDNDCDGDIDEEGSTTWYIDYDGDGFGSGSYTVESCEQPTGYVADATDCDDADGAAWPGADEYCDGVDTDCDGTTDEGDALDADTWYADSDGDGFGDPDTALTACSQPTGYVSDDTDCEDTEITAYPDSTETETPGDGIDTDCDGIDACTDLNCDGIPDLIIGQYYSGSSYTAGTHLYYGDGAGFSDSDRADLTTYGVWGEPAAADLDGDGYLDVVVPMYYTDSGYSATSSVFWGSASGHSDSDRTDLTTYGALGLVISDLNQDGWLDLVFADHYYSSYSVDSYVYWGSSGGFTSATALPTLGALAVEVEDVDQDGWDDIVFCNYHDGSSHQTSSYIYHGSSGRFSTSSRTDLPTQGCRGIVIEDLNSDGYTDLAFANQLDGSNYYTNSYVYWGTSAGWSTAYRDSLPTYGTLSVSAGDADGDGYTDLVFGGYHSGSWSSTAYTMVYYNSSLGFSSSVYDALTTTGARRLVMRDLDDDGYPELVVPIYYDGSSYYTDSYVYAGSASGYSDSDRTALSTLGPLRVAVDDFDRDGSIDLLFGGYYLGSWSTLPDSYLYWGNASGYSSSDMDTLDTDGMVAAPVLVGRED